MGTHIVTDKLQPKEPLTPLDLKNVAYIIVHHAKASKCTWEDINRWHKGNGWNCAGYGEFIAKSGEVYILRGDNVGAHCADNKKNYNPISYGICLEGDYDVEEIPQVQLTALIQRVRFNQARMKSATVVPHKKLTATDCPGKKFPWDKLMIGITMPILKFGSRGDGVSFLQTQLRAKGFVCGRLDGLFGIATKRSVIQFQQKNGLVADGIVGPVTWGVLL